MSETSTSANHHIKLADRARARSLQRKKNYVLAWAAITALTLICTVARTPAYSAAMSAPVSTERTTELAIYAALAAGFVIGLTLLVQSAMAYFEEFTSK
jgi:hypothetical protein